MPFLHAMRCSCMLGLLRRGRSAPIARRQRLCKGEEKKVATRGRSACAMVSFADRARGRWRCPRGSVCDDCLRMTLDNLQAVRNGFAGWTMRVARNFAIKMGYCARSTGIIYHSILGLGRYTFQMRERGSIMFGVLIVCYLFLGGLGGGLCLVLSIMGLTVPREEIDRGISSSHRSFFRYGYTASTCVLVAAALCLLADAGNHGALTHLFFSGRITYLSVGSYMIVGGIAFSALFAYLWAVRSSVKRVKSFRALQIAAAFVGLAVALYTGLFLASMQAVPFWNTPWLPLLFLLSSVSCGLVAALIVGQMSGVFSQFEQYFSRMAVVDAVVLVLEAVCLLGLVLDSLIAGDSASASVAASLSANMLLFGEYAWFFWSTSVSIGLVAAFIVDVVVMRSGQVLPGRPCYSMAPAICVFAGAFALRFCIVMAGEHPVASLLGA